MLGITVLVLNPLFFECRITLQPLGKTLLMPRQTRTNKMMRLRKPERLHLVHRFQRGPSLLRYAVSRNHHTRTIISQPAMHKILLALILMDHGWKLRKDLIMRPRAMARNRHTLDAQPFDFFFLAAIVGVRIDYNLYSQVVQRFNSRAVQQPATAERRSHFSKIVTRSTFGQWRARMQAGLGARFAAKSHHWAGKTVAGR
jgi:hypothetical protein